jgi:uncharacterized membrane protein YjfL (UPF0719 family)
MSESTFQWVFWASIVWVMYMATFRHKQLIEVDQHMRGNLKNTARGLGKGVKFGVGIVRFLSTK